MIGCACVCVRVRVCGCIVFGSVSPSLYSIFPNYLVPLYRYSIDTYKVYVHVYIYIYTCMYVYFTCMYVCINHFTYIHTEIDNLLWFSPCMLSYIRIP